MLPKINEDRSPIRYLISHRLSISFLRLVQSPHYFLEYPFRCDLPHTSEVAFGASFSSVFSAGAAVQWDFDNRVSRTIRSEAKGGRGGSEESDHRGAHRGGYVDGGTVVGEEQVASG